MISVLDDRHLCQPNSNPKPINIMLKLYGHNMSIGHGADRVEAKKEAIESLSLLINQVKEVSDETDR